MTIWRQIFKFAVVGATSFCIDLGVRTVLLFYVPYQGGFASEAFGTWVKNVMPDIFSFAKTPLEAAAPFAFFAGACISITNSFTWNRLWTFGIRGKESIGRQLRRYLGVYAVGLVLNTGSSTLFNTLLGRVVGDPHRTVILATVLAAIVGAGWNFMGQRAFVFRTSDQAPG